jgi:hypothetical protein
LANFFSLGPGKKHFRIGFFPKRGMGQMKMFEIHERVRSLSVSGANLE